MKNKIMPLILMLIVNTIIAQQFDTLYYNSNWESSDKSDYNYYRIIEKIEGEVKTLEYSKDGQIQMEGIYLTLEPEIENGHFIFYSGEGNKQIEGDFSQGKMINDWKYYNKKGEIEKELNYSYVLKKDEAIDFKELTEKMMKEGFMVQEMPVFNNGDFDVFKNYILKNLIAPPIPKKFGIKGKVFLQFVINKKGEIVNAEIKKSIHPHIDNEILRIVSESPKWRPAKNNNQLIDIPVTIPLEIN